MHTRGVCAASLGHWGEDSGCRQYLTERLSNNRDNESKGSWCCESKGKVREMFACNRVPS